MILPINTAQLDLNYTPASEEALISDLQAKLPQAFSYLIDRDYDRLVTVAKRIVRNDQDAEDALQNALISALRAIDRFEGNSKLSTWMHRIVVNESLMILRRQRRRNEINLHSSSDDDQVRPGMNDAADEDNLYADEQLEVQESHGILHDHIKRLPPLYREIIEMRDLQEMNTEESAEALGVSTSVVKTRLHRARQALKSSLEARMDSLVLN